MLRLSKKNIKVTKLINLTTNKKFVIVVLYSINVSIVSTVLLIIDSISTFIITDDVFVDARAMKLMTLINPNVVL